MELIVKNFFLCQTLNLNKTNEGILYLLWNAHRNYFQKLRSLNQVILDTSHPINAVLSINVT